MNPNPIDALAEQFEKFPGIGPRQAKRFVYYLLSRGLNDIDQLSEQIKNIRNSVSQCNLCMRMFSVPYSKTEPSTLCAICRDKNRDSSVLMLVSRESDLDAVEKSRAYKGLYFVLGGTLAVLEKEPEKKIRSRELINRIVNATSILQSASGATSMTSTAQNAPNAQTQVAPTATTTLIAPISEVILSMNATTEGENTADYIKRILAEIMEKRGLKFAVTTLGRGLSTGSELEYADSETIRSALENKK